MTDTQRRERNERRLVETYPTFAERLRATIVHLERQGLRPRIQEAWRSIDDQVAAFQSGHARLRYGFHNVTGTGGRKDALAVDLLVDDHPARQTREHFLRLAAAAERHGLTTGIRWGLPPVLRKAIDDAIAAKAWGAPVKIGWDPAHVETRGVTMREARAGMRPI